MSHREEIPVFDELCSGEGYSTMDCELPVRESTTQDK